jgi:3-phenylpropionate/trans-cinnamate dioxygenase ferredoxin reductase component
MEQDPRLLVHDGRQKTEVLGLGDGWDEQVFEDEGEAFTVWYGNEGTLVGVLSHNADDDYERGALFSR